MYSGFLSKLESFIQSRLEDVDEASHLLIKDARITLRECWLQDTVEDFMTKQKEIKIFPRDVQVSLDRDKSATIPLTKASNGEMDLFLFFPDEKFLVIELKFICKGRLFNSENDAKNFAENDVDNSNGFTKPTSQNLFSFKNSTGRSKESICLIRKDSIWTYDMTVGTLANYATKQARIYADSIYIIGQLCNSSLIGKDIYYCSIVVAGLHVHVSHIGKADGHTYEVVKLVTNNVSSNSPPVMTPNKTSKSAIEQPTFDLSSLKSNLSSTFSFAKPSDSVNSSPTASSTKSSDSVKSPSTFSFAKPSDSVNAPSTFSFTKPSNSVNLPSTFSFTKPSNPVNSPSTFSFAKFYHPV